MVYALSGFGILLIVGLWVFGYRLRKAGETAFSAKVAEKTSDILRKEEEAAAAAAKTDDALLQRLDEGKF